MVARQREMGQAGGVVMDGRDIGTAVFPDADVKFYVDAHPRQRAARRHEELAQRGQASTSTHRARDPGAGPRRFDARGSRPSRARPTPSTSTPPSWAWTRCAPDVVRHRVPGPHHESLDAGDEGSPLPHRVTVVRWYHGHTGSRPRSRHPGRGAVQTGVRMEKRLLKVLKALAELLDLSLGDLLEASCSTPSRQGPLRRRLAAAHRRAEEDLRPRPAGRG